MTEQHRKLLICAAGIAGFIILVLLVPPAA